MRRVSVSEFSAWSNIAVISSGLADARTHRDDAADPFGTDDGR
jgi:hypothetical protein